MSNSVVEVRNLKKSYKNFNLDVSFDIPKGYIMGFIGENGAGKTTTLKCLMNAINKESGDIKIFGLNYKENEVEIKDRIGFVNAEFDYFQSFKLEKIKKIIAPFYSKWNDEVFNNYIDRFELDLKQKYMKLSTGMKMKFSLALALSHNAELLILDEPTSGLDPVFRDKFLDILLAEVQDENKSVIFSSHITSDLEKIADYITFIQKGKIIFSEEKYELMEKYSVVKGDTSISGDFENLFQGIKKSKYGFEAITNNKKEVQAILGNSVAYETPTLDKIMVLYCQDKL